MPMSTTAASPAAQPKARNAKGKERMPAPTDELIRVTTLERAVPSGSAMPPPPPAAEGTVPWEGFGAAVRDGSASPTKSEGRWAQKSTLRA